MRPILFRWSRREWKKQHLPQIMLCNSSQDKFTIFIWKCNKQKQLLATKKIRNLEAIKRHASIVKLYNYFCTRNISNLWTKQNSPVSPNVFRFLAVKIALFLLFSWCNWSFIFSFYFYARVVSWRTTISMLQFVFCFSADGWFYCGGGDSSMQVEFVRTKPH